ncbi:hypothetical protein LT85_2429 [Collimonas arenae]|uniref:Uncharacterized protein n=1 Tax=Collimonas arenae TaxID=279058 RepID=A0A0A1FFF6_9BURK|nr:hypothetical protein LT85_2429 [Collimonas arenae]
MAMGGKKRALKLFPCMASIPCRIQLHRTQLQLNIGNV